MPPARPQLTPRVATPGAESAVYDCLVLVRKMQTVVKTKGDGKKTENTHGELTSQNLWSQNERHFVGITWHIVWSYGSKIYCVVQIKLNQLI